MKHVHDPQFARTGSFHLANNAAVPRVADHPDRGLGGKDFAKRVGLLLSLVAILAAGCGSGEKSSTEIRAGGHPISEEEVQDAVRRILASSEPVPLPEIRLPQPPSGFVRFSELLDAAKIETKYRMPELRDQELLPPGGASLGDVGPGVTVELPYEDEDPSRSLYLHVGVPAEEIGEIVVRGSFGGVDFFEIDWFLAALRFEVQETEESAEYVISADGLTNFSGLIENLRLGVSKQAVEPRMQLDSVRIRDRRATYRAPAGLARPRLAREVREAVYAHGTTTIRFPSIPVVGSQRLTFAVAVIEEPVRLRLSIESLGERTEIFDELLVDSAAWRDHTVPIAAAGAEMTLVAEFDGPPEAVAFLAAPTLYRPRPDPPRILLYLIDTLSADHVSLHGYPRNTTPHLERLAREGTWFTNGFANSSHTRASVPQLITSLHTVSNGVHSSYSRLAEDFVTLAEVLGAAGYATAAFSTNANAGPQRGTDQGFDSFFDHVAATVPDDRKLRTVPIPKVVNWLENRRDRPTFLYVHTAEPHRPYQPPPPYDTLFDANYLGQVDGGRLPSPEMLRNGTFTDRDLEHLVALYDGEVAFADRMFGALCEKLEERGLLENSLVVVTADHGEGFGQHGRFGHGGFLFPELLRVPIIFWGGGLPGIGKVDLNAQLLDLMPTLIELADLDVSLPGQGESLAPILRGEGAAPSADRPILATVYLERGPRLALIRDGWKLNLDLASTGSPTVSLFNMDADPGERHDLVSEYSGATRRLLRDLAGIYRALPRYDVAQTRRYEISQEQYERLRAMGYVQ